MTLAHAGEAFALHVGDCRDVLAELGADTVDAIVTDPPYELGFMGADWDRTGVAYDPRTWTECLRVLKPGAHLIVFGGPRTYHRMAVAVEDAGFELRDSIMWIHGQGFPKGLDVGKAIDKRRDDLAQVRQVCRWLRARIAAHPSHTFRTLADLFGYHTRMIEHWAANDSDSQPTVPTVEQWARLRDALGFGPDMDDAVHRLNTRKHTPGEAYTARPVTGTVEPWADRTAYAMTTRDGLRRDTPTSEAALAWDGWNTTLKPAHEPILVARKPLGRRGVADNVTTYGTGALNIGACRVPTGEATGRTRSTALGLINDDAWAPRVQSSESHPGGRWPTNVVLSHLPQCAPDGPCVEVCPLVELDAQSGVLTSGANPSRRAGDKFRTAYGEFAGERECTPARGVDTGGASRFYPSFRYPPEEAERESHPGGRWPTNVVLSHLPQCAADGACAEGCPLVELDAQSGWSRSPVSTGRGAGGQHGAYSPIGAQGRVPAPGDAGGASRFYPSFRYQPKAPKHERPVVDGVAHTTVKPLDLVAWLVRLVAPVGALVLDPFLGSGTTAQACEREGVRCVGVEREPAYVPLIMARLDIPAPRAPLPAPPVDLSDPTDTSPGGTRT